MSDSQLRKRDPFPDQPSLRTSLFSTTGSDQKWQLNMKPKQVEDFLHSPPPASFFSRTFKKPNQKALTQDSPPSRTQPQEEHHTKMENPEGSQTAEELPQTRSTQSHAQEDKFFSRGEGRNGGPQAFGSRSEHDLNSSQAPFPDLLGGSVRDAKAQDQVRGSQDSASEVAEKGVAIRPRHERVASLNAWSQETAPIIGMRGDQQEAGEAVSSQGQTVPTNDKSQKTGKAGFGYQNADAAGSFDFRLPPAPDQRSADQSRSASRDMIFQSMAWGPEMSVNVYVQLYSRFPSVTF